METTNSDHHQSEPPAADMLFYQGNSYPLKEYIPVSAYAQKCSISLTTLISRIERGSLLAVSTLAIPQWGLKLIRDQVYPVSHADPEQTPNWDYSV